MTITALVKNFFEMWKLFLSLLVGVNLVCIFLLLSIKEEFKSESYLVESKLSQNSSGAGLGGLGILANSQDSYDAALAIEYMKSREFLYSFIEKFSLHEHYFPRKQLDDILLEETFLLLKNKVSLSSVSDFSKVYKISLRSYSPAFSSEMTENLIVELNSQLAKKEYLKSNETADFLLQELEKTNDSALSNSLFQLLNEEVRRKTLAQTNEKEFIFRVAAKPYPELKRAYPPSRMIVLILINIIFTILFLFSIVFWKTTNEIFKKAAQ
ncbi:MAG: hypothetical protein ISP94_00275 [SAR86 cluster bacterium]|nr:hypothetical protein [SAR86 cluster bacterium]